MNSRYELFFYKTHVIRADNIADVLKILDKQWKRVNGDELFWHVVVHLWDENGYYEIYIPDLLIGAYVAISEGYNDYRLMCHIAEWLPKGVRENLEDPAQEDAKYAYDFVLKELLEEKI